MAKPGRRPLSDEDRAAGVVESYDITGPIRVSGEVLAERLRQIEAERPDDHSLAAWAWLLARRVTDLQCPPELGVTGDPRRLLVEVAAIAIAAIEAIDRVTGNDGL